MAPPGLLLQILYSTREVAGTWQTIQLFLIGTGNTPRNLSFNVIFMQPDPICRFSPLSIQSKEKS